MFTADADALAEERAGTSPRSREAGFAGAVPKPFIVEEFLATLRGAVQGTLFTGSDAVAIFPDPSGQSAAEWARTDFFSTAIRSEERRVGKEGRSRGSRESWKEKHKNVGEEVVGEVRGR